MSMISTRAAIATQELATVLANSAELHVFVIVVSRTSLERK